MRFCLVLMDDRNKKELPPKYNPHGLEKKWYPFWEKEGHFSWKTNANGTIEKTDLAAAKKIKESGKTFSIVIPPPNVTGSLHLGHALNHTIQDILTRYHRMKGDHTLWLPGTDHAGIATQNVVEKLLAKEGSSRWELGRDKFEERVWQWKEESGGMITHQQRELGESVDWNYERFTMDAGLSHTVREVFVSLYREGLIYRGERIINWCPHCVTALSNIEVEYQDRKGKLYYVKYPLLQGGVEGEDAIAKAAQKAIEDGHYLTVATTRPETMLGDEAVAVHPEDDRYREFAGKKVLLPLMNRLIPVIADDFVDLEFGTGAVKITPAHDPNDFEAGRRHDLPITRILDDHGKTNDLAGPYAGVSREKAREMVVKDLEERGYLEKTDDIKHAVGECYRCQTIVEPITSQQWFVKVGPLAEKAIEAVKSGEVEFIPKRWENTYFEWMYNIQDWCISRQLWWGHRIPAYFCESCGEMHVSIDQPEKCGACGAPAMRQEDDVLDTWFSSGLWPFSTMLSEEESRANTGWPVSNQELSLFYPTSVLVTGFDIIFFWVARMIMMGCHFMKEVPFRKVYIHGLVRDAERKKMSKSKGNVVNPLEKMEEYGADAFRFFLVAILPEGKDIIYDESRLKGYSAFTNKIWNTARFIWMNQDAGYAIPGKAPEKLGSAERWILSRLNRTMEKTRDALENMRFADYAQALYDFVWKDFCDNYVELSKISLKDESRAETARYVLNRVFIDALKLLHPVMPFITEELYSYWFPDRPLITAAWPEKHEDADAEAAHKTEQLLHLIYKIRNLRGELQIAPGEKFAAYATVAPEYRDEVTAHAAHIEQLARLSSFEVRNEAEGLDAIASPFDFGTLYLDVKHMIDLEQEKVRLTKEMTNLESYMSSLEKKLGNADFVNRAPKELIDSEQEKKEATVRKLSELKNLLGSLN